MSADAQRSIVPHDAEPPVEVPARALDPLQEKRKRRVFVGFALLMLAAAVILFCAYWFHWRNYETTDTVSLHI